MSLHTLNIHLDFPYRVAFTHGVFRPENDALAGLMEQMIALQHKTLEVLERLAPKPRTRRTAMADDVLPVKKMHFDGMSYREIHGLTGLSETAIFCIVNDRFEQRPDGRLRLLPNLQIPA